RWRTLARSRARRNHGAWSDAMRGRATRFRAPRGRDRTPPPTSAWSGGRRGRGRGCLRSLRGLRAAGPAIEEGQITRALELSAQPLDRAVLERPHRTFAPSSHWSHISGTVPLYKTQEEHFAIDGLELCHNDEEVLVLGRAVERYLNVHSGHCIVRG